MNARDRVFGTLQGLPVDHRPVAPVLSLYGARLTGCPLPQYYTDAAAYARGQRAVFGMFHPDLLLAPFVLSAEAAAFGSEEHFADHRPPNICRLAAEGMTQLGRLTVPSPDRHPRLLYVRDALRRVRDAHGGDAIVGAVCLSPIDLPPLIIGLDAWMDVLLDEGQDIERVLDLTLPFFVAWANALLADGADLLMLPVAFCNAGIVTRRIAEHIAVPALTRAFAAVKGPIVFHHGGGPLGPFLPFLKDLPNVVGFALGPADSLMDARLAVGPDKLLLGQIDGPSLDQQSPDDIEAECRRTLDDMAADPRFILATSAADIPLRTPPANVFAVTAAARGHHERTATVPAASDATVVVSCSAFEPGIEAMRRAGRLVHPVIYVDSVLHMFPHELETILASVVEALRREGRQAAVVFGDCHPHMCDLSEQAGVTRVNAINCCDLHLGRDRYRRLRREGAFFLLPEWTGRWREIFDRALGPQAEGVRTVMTDMHTKLVHLRPPGADVPARTLDEIAEHTGLPWEVEDLDPEVFAECLTRLLRAEPGDER